MSERITINPDICNGKPVVRGTRITVQTVLEFIAGGEKLEDCLYGDARAADDGFAVTNIRVDRDSFRHRIQFNKFSVETKEQICDLRITIADLGQVQTRSEAHQ